jgi:hypothetical protein
MSLAASIIILAVFVALLVAAGYYVMRAKRGTDNDDGAGKDGNK